MTWIPIVISVLQFIVDILSKFFVKAPLRAAKAYAATFKKEKKDE